MSGAAHDPFGGRARYGRERGSPGEEPESHEGIGLLEGVTSDRQERTFRRSNALKSVGLIEGKLLRFRSKRFLADEAVTTGGHGQATSLVRLPGRETPWRE
jgi:hypothetical protein